MIVAESRRGRRLVGRLDKGADVMESLAEICRSHDVRAAEVRAIGKLNQVVMSEYEQNARQFRASRRFDSSFEMISFNGNISERDGKLFVHAHVALSRELDNGIEMIGGHLVSARAFSFEFVIEAFDDLILRRQNSEAQTGLPLWKEAIAMDAPAPAAAHVPFDAPARTTWDDVVSASTAPPPEPPPVVEEPLPDGDGEEVRVAPGDLIDHPKFGRCVVERVEGDYEFVSARLRNQRLIRLSLDVLRLLPAGEEAGKRLFRAIMGA